MSGLSKFCGRQPLKHFIDDNNNKNSNNNNEGKSFILYQILICLLRSLP